MIPSLKVRNTKHDYGWIHEGGFDFTTGGGGSAFYGPPASFWWSSILPWFFVALKLAGAFAASIFLGTCTRG